jgi:hypothetical protein
MLQEGRTMTREEREKEAQLNAAGWKSPRQIWELGECIWERSALLEGEVQIQVLSLDVTASDLRSRGGRPGVSKAVEQVPITYRTASGILCQDRRRVKGE